MNSSRLKKILVYSNIYHNIKEAREKIIYGKKQLITRMELNGRGILNFIKIPKCFKEEQ